MSAISVSSSSDDDAAGPLAAVAALTHKILTPQRNEEIELHDLSGIDLQEWATSFPSWIHCDTISCLDKSVAGLD
jgi:hypothetical protein